MQEMMPGKILVRAIRVDQTMYTNENVKAARARDKILSMFEESRQREVSLRRGWALPCHTCAGTEHSPATPAPGLGLPLPHLRWDWALRCHICTRTGRQVDEQRKGLSLAPLYPKPRPMWEAPACIALFGDAYIAGAGCPFAYSVSML